jgi:hypothetical protein
MDFGSSPMEACAVDRGGVSADLPSKAPPQTTAIARTWPPRNFVIAKLDFRFVLNQVG